MPALNHAFTLAWPVAPHDSLRQHAAVARHSATVQNLHRPEKTVLAEVRALHSVPRHTLQGAAIDPEHLGSGGLVVIDPCQHFVDVPALEDLERRPVGVDRTTDLRADGGC